MSASTETPAIALNTAQGLSVWVPASLECVTTYVLLEQEAWFEHEVDFVVDWLEDGMTAVDVGASYGLYALAMARKVAPAGKVYAFEPSPGTRALLERSKVDNGLDRLIIAPLALSNQSGERVLFQWQASELDTLNGRREEAASATEVMVSTLDEQAAALGLERLDFIKIDAEGEEANILAGGEKTLREHSPLVLMEILNGGVFQLDLPQALRDLGYEVYRLTGDRSMLVPWDLEDTDDFSLNVFAAKPDRAAALAEMGLLARRADEARIDEAALADAWRAVEALPYSATYGAQRQAGDDEYVSAIAGYFIWKDKTRPPEERYGALRNAVNQLNDICMRAPTLARLSTLARAAFEGGWRRTAITALEVLVRMGQTDPTPKNEPFIAANPRFDSIAPGDNAQAWFPASALEQFERLSHFSSRWVNDHGRILRWLCHSPFADPQIVRRLLLRAVIDGETEVETLNWVRGDYPHLNPAALEGDQLLKMMKQG